MIDIVGLTTFTPNVPLEVILHHANGTKESIVKSYLQCAADRMVQGGKCS